MNFELTTQHKRIQAQCRELATDFATRAAEHDREASNPVENYALLREAEFHTLNIPTELGGWGEQLFGHSLALEQLAQGCPATRAVLQYAPGLGRLSDGKYRDWRPT